MPVYYLFYENDDNYGFDSLIETNKFILDNKDKKLLSLVLDDDILHIKVDYTTGNIYVDDVLTDLDLSQEEQELINAEPNPDYRFINFRRKRSTRDANGKTIQDLLLCRVIGWQTTVNNINIQRMVANKGKGRWEIWKKR